VTIRDFDARLVIYGLPKHYHRVAEWLRDCADSIEHDPDHYSPTFTAKLMKHTAQGPGLDAKQKLSMTARSRVKNL